MGASAIFHLSSLSHCWIRRANGAVRSPRYVRYFARWPTLGPRTAAMNERDGRRSAASPNTGNATPGACEGSMLPSLASYVIEMSADAIVHTCPAGTIRTWNRGAAEVFGITKDEAVGRDLTHLVVPEHVRHLRPLDLNPKYGHRDQRRAPALCKDGSLFTAEFTVQDLGALDGTVVTLRDASAMGETVRRLRTRVAELEADMGRLVQFTRPGATLPDPLPDK